jgi:hypothetical protein
MIDGYFHFELNGVKYRAAEDASGGHYSYQEQTFRPTNFAVVQGEANKFQIRPDILLWSWTDWSGGAGQLKFDQQEPNRAMVLENVDPFSKPGKLIMGSPSAQLALDNVGSTWVKRTQLVEAIGGLYGTEENNNPYIYLWDETDRFGAAITITGMDGGCNLGGADGDATKIYLKEDATADIFSYNGSTSEVHNSDTGETGQYCQLLELGDYIYLLNPQTTKVHEIPKTGTPPVASIVILDHSNTGSELIDVGQGQFTKGDNRLYVLQVNGDISVIYEIIPSSAAATGFGTELDRFEGFRGEALWYHLGYLFLAGTFGQGAEGVDRAILYIHPDGAEFGTLGYVRGEEWLGHTTPVGPTVPSRGGNIFYSAFVIPPSHTNTDFNSLWVIDSVTGGMAQIATWDALNPGGDEQWIAGSVREHNGNWFIGATELATNPRVMYFDMSLYSSVVAAAGANRAVSPSIDFGLSDQKVLNSIQLSTEPMPASGNWTLTLNVYVDGDTTPAFTDTYSTASGTGTTFLVSTDTTTVEFRSLVLEITSSNSGAAEADVPIITGVDVRATVSKRQPVWQILLDCADEHAEAQGRNLRGSDLITNVLSIGEDVVDFKDGYKNKLPNTFSQHDVNVDVLAVSLERPGEGVIQVALREVV